MATTYTLIKGETLASSAASYTFSAIPSTWTDLVVRISARDDGGSARTSIYLELNADTSAKYSATWLYGSGSSAASSRLARGYSPDNYEVAYDNSGTSTSNTFSNSEIYFPNYTSTASKPYSSFSAQENNTTAATMGVFASLYSGTSGISQIKLFTGSAALFVAGSSFYLYGIKNS